MATPANKQSLWDAYIAAARKQDKADARLRDALYASQKAAINAKKRERYADDAYAAWERA